MDHVTHLGLDVHKDTIAVAILRPDQNVPDERVIPNTPEALCKLVGRRRGSVVACYEAGPTGYETHRLLSSLGVPCDVIAPTLIPRRAGRRVKTDRLDARNLARLHRAGELTAIRVPTSEEEALRDLIRVREDLKDDRRKTMHRVKSFLLRQGRRYPGKATGWTDKFDLWVRGLALHRARGRCSLPPLPCRFGHSPGPAAGPGRRTRGRGGAGTTRGPGGKAPVLPGHRHAVRGDHRGRSLRLPPLRIRRLVHGLHRPAPLRVLERRKRTRGSITKAGNAHLRRVLVEAAWSYRHRPAVGVELRRRSEGQPPEVLAYAWAAQCRLSSRFHQLAARREHNVAIVAVARELAGFIWGLMTDRIAVVA